MRRREGRRSDHIEDRRSMSVPRGVRVSGMGGLVILVPVVLSVLLGIDPKGLLQEGPTVNSSYVSAPPDDGPGGPVTGHDELRDLVAVALAGTEDIWREFLKDGWLTNPTSKIIWRDAGMDAW
jgi:predicted metalloprotease